MTLEQLRRHIDRLDHRLLELVNRRARLALRVGRLKKEQGRRMFDPARERAILRRLTNANRGPLSTGAVRAIYREIVRQSRRLEHSA
ncbi:MAG: chorismate mutase [Candidatus Omnitrophica bacterium]|nr:chorismate mutase [Candidatus Omnitrophota bacterium]